ncbi:hypothetical protein LNTAR_07539 [Lentisphaera araneosa HTCC2155]|uniref:Lipoprotein n=1 Tax=Lentisphaera araneosa HTCC2155 TaxID=313628 RepID=A6DN43_9BACT|nr:hypothetical protein [Lentisphaera araneosa]EDM27079.1 hypothetical protein LNTAR_07539 [Lentisphaera araneosa HTCC2155]
MYKHLLLICTIFALFSCSSKQVEPTDGSVRITDINKELELKREAFRTINKVYARYHWRYKGDDLTEDEKKNRTYLWSDARKKRELAYKQYILTLLEYWSILPNQSEQSAQIQTELKQAIAGRYNKNTESEMNEKLLLAELSWSYLAQAQLDAYKAKFLSTLITIPKEVKHSDMMHALGLPIEPYGWNLQINYSLTLIRADQLDAAHKELSKVKSKAFKYQQRTYKQINAADFSQMKKRDQEHTYKRYKRQSRQVQLCELLQAIIAVKEDNKDEAQKLYHKALSYKIELTRKVQYLLQSKELLVFQDNLKI